MLFVVPPSDHQLPIAVAVEQRSQGARGPTAHRLYIASANDGPKTFSVPVAFHAHLRVFVRVVGGEEREEVP